MKIIFMGTPEFAIPSFLALHNDEQIDIVCVYTKAPKPAGRGKQESKSPIHLLAEQYGYDIYTPSSLKNLQNPLPQADVIVVVAYGLILPANILSHCPAINLHPSALPRWRGAAPLTWTILAGDYKSCVCTMLMDEGMDTGDIILQEEVIIDDNTCLSAYSEKCAKIGANLILKTVKNLANLPRFKQDSAGITYAKKLSHADAKLNWHEDVRLVQRKIMAFSPKPGAYFIYDDEEIKIIDSEFITYDHNYSFGRVIDDKMSIACRGGIIFPKLLKRAGRKEIYTDAFLRGYKIKKGSQIT